MPNVAPRRGTFVRYWDERGFEHVAHVVRVEPLELRIHRTAQPDLDVKNVPFSPVPRAGCWGWRAA